ncbi:MAG: GWxTD domain-containing protein [Candidatus Aminicenantes bacterium]|nr:GWxTD domain-containing protein [Candidatus Aminicenantes bacterium]
MKKPIISAFLLLSLLLLGFCASYKLEKTLDPEHQEFLSKVRYIITRQERKIFLNLPSAERAKFIEEFWKKRDPDPDTEENEFKNQYFTRIEEANQLFRDGGKQGWLQDRGRIYILLGPPDERETYPRGYSFYGKPIEIWHYGFFPIVFIDAAWNGNYELEPLSAYHIAEINKAQMEMKPEIAAEKVVFDFNLRIEKIKDGNILIIIGIPYKNIWFREEENRLKTEFKILIEAFDPSGKKVREVQKDYPLDLKKDSLKDTMGKEHIMEIPLSLDNGSFTMTIELENKTDGSRVRKKISLVV